MDNHELEIQDFELRDFGRDDLDHYIVDLYILDPYSPRRHFSAESENPRGDSETMGAGANRGVRTQRAPRI